MRDFVLDLARRIAPAAGGGSLIFGTPEVGDLINCLGAIDDPADQVAALRSPAFAGSDVESLDLVQPGGKLDYRSRDQVTEGPALAVLQAYYQSKLGTSGRLEAVILDREERRAQVRVGPENNPFGTGGYDDLAVRERKLAETA